MTTTKSYSESARFWVMFRYSLRDFLPVAILSAIISILLLPVQYSTSIGPRLLRSLPEMPTVTDPETAVRYLAENFAMGFLGDNIASLGLVCAFFFSLLGVVAAIMGARHLHSKPMTDLYYALPVKRRDLLSAHLLAGGVALFLPYLLSVLVTMGMQIVSLGSYGCFGSSYFLWSLAEVVTILFAAASVALFVTIIAVNLGSSFDAQAISMALGFSPMLVYLVSVALMGHHLYGVNLEPDNVQLLSPLTWSVHAYLLRDDAESTKDFLPFLLVWLLMLVVLYTLAIFFYQRRKSELAGLSQGDGPLPKIVKGVAAFVGGAAFFFIFSPRSLPSQLFYLLFGAAAAGIVTELILSRGVRLLKKNAAWPLVGAACLLLVFFAARADLLGLERKIPSIEEVESVSIDYNGRFDDLAPYYAPYYASRDQGGRQPLTDPDSVAIVLETHRDAVLHKPGDDVSDENSGGWLSISYTLKNGRELNRYYNSLYLPAALNLAKLEAEDDFIHTHSPLFQLRDDSLDRHLKKVELFDSFWGNGAELRLDGERSRRLVEAVKQDLLTETLGEITQPSSPALGYLELTIRPLGEYGKGYGTVAAEYAMTKEGLPFAQPEEYLSSYLVVLTREYRGTMDLLEEWGYAGQLGRELEGVTKVSLLPLDEYWGRETRNRVSVITRDSLLQIRDSLSYNAGEALKQAPLGQVEEVYRSSHNQMLLDDPATLSYAIFQDDEGIRGVKILRSGSR